jgi:uncharacterized protein (TIGR02996 family)
MRSLYDHLNDPEEQPFLVKLLADSADLAARNAYAGWLQERNDPRAEPLRIANRLLAGVADSVERKQLASRLNDLRDDDWFWRLAATPIAVRNCGEKISDEPRVRFAFECPETWASMQPTSDEKVRFCERCRASVVRCDSLAEAERHALLGACISVDARLTAQAHDRYCQMVTGRPDVNEYWARRLFSR